MKGISNSKSQISNPKSEIIPTRNSELGTRNPELFIPIPTETLNMHPFTKCHSIKTVIPARGAARCRGGVYLAVLGASMIISVLGVAGLYAVNLQARISVNANNAMRAAVACDAAIELGRTLIRGDAGWRSNYKHDTWTADLSFEGGSIAFKLVDETDGNLGNNSTDPVRIHGKATFGKAVRIQSVQLLPNGSGLMLPVAGTWRQEVMP